jgi:hypothetical protein
MWRGIYTLSLVKICSGFQNLLGGYKYRHTDIKQEYSKVISFAYFNSFFLNAEYRLKVYSKLLNFLSHIRLFLSMLP